MLPFVFRSGVEISGKEAPQHLKHPWRPQARAQLPSLLVQTSFTLF